LANGRSTKALGVLFMLAILTLVFCAGAYLGQLTFEPRVIIEHEVIERVVYKPVERVIERVVYEPVEKIIETVVYEPVEKVIVEHVETTKPLREFQSLEELEQWLVNIEVLDIHFDMVDKETGQHIKGFDCEDYAIRLQEKALRDGYVMSFEVIRPVEYNALFKQKRIPADKIHAINSVIIGNEVYYIEPQTREVVLSLTSIKVDYLSLLFLFPDYSVKPIVLSLIHIASLVTRKISAIRLTSLTSAHFFSTHILGIRIQPAK